MATALARTVAIRTQRPSRVWSLSKELLWGMVTWETVDSEDTGERKRGRPMGQQGERRDPD
jgi:hypothetical protein